MTLRESNAEKNMYNEETVDVIKESINLQINLALLSSKELDKVLKALIFSVVFDAEAISAIKYFRENYISKIVKSLNLLTESIVANGINSSNKIIISFLNTNFVIDENHAAKLVSTYSGFMKNIKSLNSKYSNVEIFGNDLLNAINIMEGSYWPNTFFKDGFFTLSKEFVAYFLNVKYFEKLNWGGFYPKRHDWMHFELHKRFKLF